MGTLPSFTAHVLVSDCCCCLIPSPQYGDCFTTGCSFQGNTKVKFLLDSLLIIRLGREGRRGNPEHGVLILLSWPNSIPPL